MQAASVPGLDLEAMAWECQWLNCTWMFTRGTLSISQRMACFCTYDANYSPARFQPAPVGNYDEESDLRGREMGWPSWRLSGGRRVPGAFRDQASLKRSLPGSEHESAFCFAFSDLPGWPSSCKTAITSSPSSRYFSYDRSGIPFPHPADRPTTPLHDLYDFPLYSLTPETRSFGSLIAN